MSDSAATSPKNGSTADAAPPSLPPLNHDLPPFDDESPSHRRKKAKVKESVIDHTYRDYSQVQVAPDSEEDASKGKKESRTNPNFPAKLHAILSNPGYQHIICWMPHGRSWNIVDKYLLTTVILPHHFSHCKFESFNRSVNGWGFKRLLGDGPDKKTYYHECFLRGRPELTKLMQRLCNPGKRLPDKSGEPNFYEISMKFPLPALPPAAPSGGRYQEQNATKPMQSPNTPQPGQPVMFSSPPPHGYMYGYPQSSPYPQMPTSAASGPNPPQQPQQMYWPGQVPSPHFQPNPYGYYPYPQMMMAPQAGPGPQGYYVAQPYQQPQYFSPTAVGAMAAAHTAAAATAGQAGMAFLLHAANDAGEPEAMKPGAQIDSNAEQAAAVNNTGVPEVMKSGALKESNAEQSAAAKNTMEPDDMKPPAKKESDAKESKGTVKNAGEPMEMKPDAQKESHAKLSTDTTKNTGEHEGMKPVAQTESDAEDEEKKEKDAEDGEEKSAEV
mmetsp:Transcript_662/g.1349  ORF Transcript_662/g.1349 Transcript_662/m.1349 type:complete len:497 (+) Transcript_662:200-1690(+)|eukprot:CAMPEP_0172311062 /NCGR_PEP_ID=MMETSP1058-20130122/13660_1 /TAXON_ID=83371 /ORGANISM="Detonula confervacea, Strain CCMP 353" /LENGTH=496 /DNA_ID=CAMNT_0013024119 /DNA_START=175 /DNA_END=1665 /DNA_ORIENTATION=-